MTAQVANVQSQDDGWTFLDKSTREYTHAMHLYPARMHPEIAKRLIKKYASSDTIVFDPFMGSGGVLLEAVLRGHDAVGLDINPFAVLLSKVKTTPISGDLDRVRANILDKSMMDYKSGEYRTSCRPVMDIESWYGECTANKLSVLKHHIFNVGDTDVRDFFKICLSLTARKASYQRNGSWKMHRMRDKENFEPDPFGMFAIISKENIVRIESLNMAMPKGIAYPVFGDTRDVMGSFVGIKSVLDSGNVNLMITSPPYGDHHTTVAYGQFVRHSSLWLDLPRKDVLAIDSSGLGGKRKQGCHDLDSSALNHTLHAVRKNDLLLTKNKKPCRTEEVYAFFHDLDSCMGQISEVLTVGDSHCCFVVANRTVRRVTIPTDTITVELGRKWGFKLEKIIRRNIPNKVMPSKNAPENIPNSTGDTMTRESVIIMKY